MLETSKKSTSKSELKRLLNHYNQRQKFESIRQKPSRDLRDYFLIKTPPEHSSLTKFI